MAGYSIFFRKSVSKDFASIPKRELRRIFKRIAALAGDPRPAGCQKLSGKEQYRIRQGTYRVVYSIEDQARAVWIVKVGHRRDVYR